MIEDRLEKIEEYLEKIKDNHMPHIYGRLGWLTGTVGILSLLILATLVSVWLK